MGEPAYLHVRITSDLHRWLKAHSAWRGMSMAEYVEEALTKVRRNEEETKAAMTAHEGDET